jgi:hypothetical protein
MARANYAAGGGRIVIHRRLRGAYDFADIASEASYDIDLTDTRLRLSA